MEILIRKSILFIVLLLSQVLLFNQIHLFHYGTPLVIVYFIMQMPIGQSRWSLLVLSFLMGLMVDIFANIPGVTAASLTIIGFIQPYLLPMFVSKDDFIQVTPSVREFGLEAYSKYAITIISIFVILFFTFESFNLHSFWDWLLRIILSTALTFLMVLLFENFRKSRD